MLIATPTTCGLIMVPATADTLESVLQHTLLGGLSEYHPKFEEYKEGLGRLGRRHWGAYCARSILSLESWLKFRSEYLEHAARVLTRAPEKPPIHVLGEMSRRFTEYADRKVDLVRNDGVLGPCELLGISTLLMIRDVFTEMCKSFVRPWHAARALAISADLVARSGSSADKWWESQIKIMCALAQI